MSALTELAGVRAEMARLDRETRAAWARYGSARDALAAAERAVGGPGTLPEAVCEALTAHRDTMSGAWHEASEGECAYLRSIARARRAAGEPAPLESA